MKIGFIGLGKLGKECAEVMAEKHEVVGYDINIVAAKGVKITDRIENTVLDKDLTFIAVPTPHRSLYGGSSPSSNLKPRDFDYSQVKQVLKEISKVKHNSIIVLISTVLPGTIRREFLEYINPNQFIYNPYLIAMGTVKEDMKNPEMVIIGNLDGVPTGNIATLISFYKTICH